MVDADVGSWPSSDDVSCALSEVRSPGASGGESKCPPSRPQSRPTDEHTAKLLSAFKRSITGPVECRHQVRFRRRPCQQDRPLMKGVHADQQGGGGWGAGHSTKLLHAQARFPKSVNRSTLVDYYALNSSFDSLAVHSPPQQALLSCNIMA